MRSSKLSLRSCCVCNQQMPVEWQATFGFACTSVLSVYGVPVRFTALGVIGAIGQNRVPSPEGTLFAIILDFPDLGSRAKEAGCGIAFVSGLKESTLYENHRKGQRTPDCKNRLSLAQSAHLHDCSGCQQLPRKSRRMVSGGLWKAAEALQKKRRLTVFVAPGATLHPGFGAPVKSLASRRHTSPIPI